MKLQRTQYFIFFVVVLHSFICPYDASAAGKKALSIEEPAEKSILPKLAIGLPDDGLTLTIYSPDEPISGAVPTAGEAPASIEPVPLNPAAIDTPQEDSCEPEFIAADDPLENVQSASSALPDERTTVAPSAEKQTPEDTTETVIIADDEGGQPQPITNEALIAELNDTTLDIRQAAALIVRERLDSENCNDVTDALQLALASGPSSLEHRRRIEALLALTYVDWSRVMQQMRAEAERQFQVHPAITTIELMRQTVQGRIREIYNQIDPAVRLRELFPLERRWIINSAEADATFAGVEISQVRVNLSYWGSGYQAALVEGAASQSIYLSRGSVPEQPFTIARVHIRDFLTSIQLRRYGIWGDENPDVIWVVRAGSIEARNIANAESGYTGELSDEDGSEMRAALQSLAPSTIQPCVLSRAYRRYQANLQTMQFVPQRLNVGRPLIIP